MAKKTMKGMTAGAATGEGRLQKIKLQKRQKSMTLEGEKGSSRGDRKSRS